MNIYLEYLRRIDEKDYITEEDHIEYMKILTEILNEFYYTIKDNIRFYGIENIKYKIDNSDENNIIIYFNRKLTNEEEKELFRVMHHRLYTSKGDYVKSEKNSLTPYYYYCFTPILLNT